MVGERMRMAGSCVIQADADILITNYVHSPCSSRGREGTSSGCGYTDTDLLVMLVTRASLAIDT